MTYEKGNYGIGKTHVKDIKIFGIKIDTYVSHESIITTSFYERILKITIEDELVYNTVKEEFTKFAEINKNDIKSIHFIKNF
jgi:hypothetical protein